jgi:hypothetical protein
MSANNQLIVQKTNQGYFINDVDMDGEGGYRITDKSFATLDEAIEYAQDYMKDHEVEYGLSFNLTFTTK